MEISVFGGGAWGRALAFAFGEKNKVKIISRRDLNEPLKELNHALVSKGSTPIEPVSLEMGLDSQLYIVAISVQHLREWFKNASLPKNAKVLIASKGIEVLNKAFVSEIAKDFIEPSCLCFLAGPSFAAEIIQGLPCALVIHSHNHALALEFANKTPSFIRAYAQEDVVGGEIAGAYKNVIAIAGGVCDGLKLGNSAKASLLSRGLVEMQRFGAYFGGKTETFLGLSGAGDLFLTANSILSRNYRVGLGLAQSKPLERILEELGEVAEGVKTTNAIVEMAQEHHIYTPIASELALLLKGKNVLESMNDLIRRT
ncbi:NAD(P)H-dependent glycerol-3-phosphate dehydrogenase [Helicobacter cetorum]|uniref:Glycerol-3-phosphate dehydrogenase [NAD(P)+] n=1 Tax=Helicobacter cetorum (strain ATCC BAA-540 / CCUG 52418 / MIT 99-5656) TaxID=1163745 RepID=I0ETN5_HELCM|nr:NAD(P)H-dependent glycerol-3-phosphate dehydrogenase [Helicobacter cetorum]AFI06304.1 NAD(P)H-dependent glycerol-3-phosphate dehydrogenase [Helicobacter cetorum MIT 99-5656]